ncbi:MAG TPA: class I SAM-dependent methyltransferase [Candidatus Polarisedimenticolia bacterium]|nr:class I SAM-dependent methyltransferase [Candidatus Polarisedimenticolia bacterium]
MTSRFEAVDLDRARDDVHQAYTVTAERVLERGFRDNPTYLATKALVDWDLLEGIDLAGKEVLNVGCLEPIDEMHFARHVRGWTAVDVHPDVIGMADRIARREMPADQYRKLTFKVEDATRMSFPDATFDIAVSYSTIEHIPGAAERRTAFAEMARVVRPGGYVAVTVPNKYSTFLPAHLRNKRGSSDYGYCYLYAPRELKRDLRACGLEIVRFSSEWHGLLTMPSFMPGFVKSLLFPLVYFGERIGCLARKPAR